MSKSIDFPYITQKSTYCPFFVIKADPLYQMKGPNKKHPFQNQLDSICNAIQVLSKIGFRSGPLITDEKP